LFKSQKSSYTLGRGHYELFSPEFISTNHARLIFKDQSVRFIYYMEIYRNQAPCCSDCNIRPWIDERHCLGFTSRSPFQGQRIPAARWRHDQVWSQ
jgi:hypothetical protein